MTSSTACRRSFKGKGFNVVNLGLYPPLSEDFTAQITAAQESQLRDRAAASSTRRNSSTFWTQCAQQGYRPKIMTPPKAMLFPSAVEALGDRGTGISTEVWWSQHHPFKSGLTGQTAQQFCDAYTAATGKQWTQPIGFKHACLEVAVDALKRAKKLDAAAIRDAIAETDYQSLVGPLTWKGGADQSGQERLHHAARRRPVEAGQEVQIRPATSSTTRRRRTSRSTARSSAIKY